MQVSVVISARDEFPNIVHTVHAIVNDLETFLDPHEWEIILVDNGSQDAMSWRFLQERGLYYHRNLRILHDPLMGNVTARNKGALLAKGKYLFFSDAHMSYRIGTFQYAIEAIEESGGIVHGGVQWMGGYDPAQPSLQYSIKVGEKLWGTWNMAEVSRESWFYIPCSGHCFLGVNRQQFLDFGGYNDYFRCYGGGELYLDMKWWMMGSSVVVEPRCVGYHLSAGRGYSYHQDDLIHNMMLLGYALGADALGERVYIRYMDKNGVNRDILNRLYTQAIEESTSDRAFLSSKNATSFYDILRDKPWDIKNMTRHGKAESYLSIFDRTWIDELNDEAQSFYDASILQKEFSEYVQKYLAHHIYKGKA
jgi:glycosyltransferase involved in cell wall biosynthesis